MNEIEGLQAQVKAYQELLAAIMDNNDEGVVIVYAAAMQVLEEDEQLEDTKNMMRGLIMELNGDV